MRFGKLQVGDGMPTMAYFHVTTSPNGFLELVRCQDFTCTGATFVTVDSATGRSSCSGS